MVELLANHNKRTVILDAFGPCFLAFPTKFAKQLRNQAELPNRSSR